MTDVINSVRSVQRQRHDTLYCDEAFKKKIIDSVSDTPSGLRADSLQVSGLNVITHKRFTHPIVCKKGELFPLAKDYQ